LFNRTWEHYKKLLYSKEKAISEYATKVGDFTSYEINLTAHLIKRMYSFCKSHSIPLIVVDIPQVNGCYDFKTSVPQELSSVIRTNSDIFIGCDQVLGKYRGAAEFHLPNGAQHISEFSHFLFGWAIAQEIAAFYGT
jgi:hypothetical protein